MRLYVLDMAEEKRTYQRMKLERPKMKLRVTNYPYLPSVFVLRRKAMALLY
jgi:hypothetical protein